MEFDIEMKDFSSQKRVQIRNSNIELLRILCMLSIIADHFIGQSGIAEYNTWGDCVFYNISFSRSACGVFIIISAWYSIDKKININKVFHSWFTVVMYTVPIMGYMLYLKFYIDKASYISAFYPVEKTPLWFVGCYIIILLLMPILNHVILTSDKNLLVWTLFCGGILISLYPMLMADTATFQNDLIALIYIYLLTGYIKVYVKKLPSTRLCIFVFVGIFLFCTIINAIGCFWENYSDSQVHMIFKSYGEILKTKIEVFPNILMEYSLFFFFLNIKQMKSKVINKLSSATLGVYCLHQVPGWNYYIWQNIFYANFHSTILTGWKRYIYVVLVVIAVWVSCTIIEIIRMNFSRLLIEERKWYKKLCGLMEKTIYNEKRNIYIYIDSFYFILFDY